jgi:NitT/TauT family transport system ATP-binding protein
LEGIDLEIARGEFVVLLGPSGCGKTTLLRMIGGLIAPSSGRLRVMNRDLWRGAARQSDAVADLGIVFQEANLFPWLTIEQNIALPLALKGVSKRERLARAHELTRLVGIAGFEGRWPRELSGGMRQRAAIARSLSYDPDILLMDEPFGALDALTREQLNIEMNRIWRETGTTVLLVTHSVAEAAYLANRVVVMTDRPGTIAEVIDVDLPAERDYAETMAQPEFARVTGRIRKLLGAGAALD